MTSITSREDIKMAFENVIQITIKKNLFNSFLRNLLSENHLRYSSSKKGDVLKMFSSHKKKLFSNKYNKKFIFH